ncbi:hypothetical protein [Streptomyces chartreusis]|uniref:hypothetical protein n=1 Tax=Streptomyces chartreusis TaxID=1969 RepID=UPI00362D913B
MNSLSVELASKAAGSDFVLLGHDIDGWTVALIAAGIAAVIYEVVMALTKMVTLRIPFLVLQIARAVTPPSLRPVLYKKWKADLWDRLRGDGHWITKFVKGMWFALGLAFHGARSTAAAIDPEAIKRQPLQLVKLLWLMATMVTTVSSISTRAGLSPKITVLFSALALSGSIAIWLFMLAVHEDRPERDK